MLGNSAVRRSETKVREIPLEVYEAGEGPPLLFLHGMSGVAGSLESIGALADSYHVVAPSHPGFGGSGRPEDIDSVDDLTYLYLDFIDQLAREEGPVTLVGCSLGGWIAAEVAIKCQASLSALVLSTPLGLKVGGPLEREIADIYALPSSAVREAMHHDPQFGTIDFSALSDEQLEEHFRNLESTALYGWKPYMHNPKLRGRLFRIGIPTLILEGESDAFLSPKHPAAYREAIAGAILDTLSEAGHEPEREQPAAFAAAVSKFLSDVHVLGNR